jgi:hypothetical protein
MTNNLPIHHRFASGLMLASGGAFLAIVSRIWSTGTIEWVGAGIGVVALLGGLALAARGARGTFERGVDGLTALLGAWTIVASFAYSGTTRLDLALWEGVGFALLGAAALLAHELTTERVVHELEVTHRSERPTAASL